MNLKSPMPTSTAANPSTSSLQDHTGFWLRYVSNHVSHRFAARLENSGVTVAEWVVLRTLFDLGACPPSEIASAVGITRGATSKLVERLRAKQLITRTEDAGDRRYQQIQITPAGKALVPKLAKLADQNDAEFFSCLSDSEHRALRRTLRKLVQTHALSQIPTE